MKPAQITVRIGSLVLDGIPLDREGHDHGRIGAALSGELERLFTARGVPPGLAAGRPPALVNLDLAPGVSPEIIGARMAEALYRAWESRGARR